MSLGCQQKHSQRRLLLENSSPAAHRPTDEVCHSLRSVYDSEILDEGAATRLRRLCGSLTSYTITVVLLPLFAFHSLAQSKRAYDTASLLSFFAAFVFRRNECQLESVDISE